MLTAMQGYGGRLLFVDCTTGTTRIEPLAEHTARARQILGKNALLCPEQMVLLEKDASKARAIARSNMKIYCGLPNYQNNLKWLGYSDADFADGGSDRLVGSSRGSHVGPDDAAQEPVSMGAGNDPRGECADFFDAR